MSNYPLIRFSGYSKPWADCKLKEYSRLITKGTTPKTKDSKGNINYIKVENLQDGKISTSSKVSENEHLSFLKRSILHEGDILFSIAGTLGRAAIVTKTILPANTNQALAIIRGYDFNSDFLLTSLGGKVVRDYVRKNPTIGAQPNLSLEQVGNLIISSPCLEEQKKIGTFFKSLDGTISLHQQELEALKQIKQGFLQKMFPRINESKPEIRIKDFQEEWIAYTMKDVFGKIKNAFVGTASPYYVENGHFYLESNNIKNGKINRKTEVFINDDFYNKQKNNWLKTGDLVMVQSGHVGHTAVIPKELNNTAAHAVIVFSDFQMTIDTDFVNYQLQTYSAKKKLHALTTGNTIKHILASEMKNFLLHIPSYEEQQKISSIFKNLDDLIEIKEQEIENIKETKKGFLQKMFV